MRSRLSTNSSFEQLRFSQEDIEHHAFPAVVKSGKQVFSSGGVTELQQIGDNLLGVVLDGARQRVTVTKKTHRPPTFACTCGFAHGGACEHAVALMLAVNAGESLQTGLVLDGAAPGNRMSRDFHSSSARNSPRNEKNGPSVVETVRPKPIPRLYLAERDGLLIAELRFSYQDGRIEFSRRDRDREKLVPVSNDKVYRVIRSRVQEDLFSADLQEEYGMSPYSPGFFTPSGDVSSWITERLPLLAERGYRIFGRENLRKFRKGSSTPSLCLSARSKGGFVECDVDAEIDGMPVTLSALAAAVEANARYVELNNGKTGEIPEAWLERLSALFAVGRKDAVGEKLLLRKQQMPILEFVGEISEELVLDEKLREQFQTLMGVEEIPEAPEPEGFVGTMRPYQAAGYQWFHFLKGYGFGGCLADDMGLGKTVQTLALLSNEKFTATPKRPSLVVVPTSILFNWEREIRKFAPKVLTMTYHGPVRKRYTKANIMLADIVLTSYGTLLRDVERLMAVSFNYVIIDEAQAIKNPGSRVSRAVRRIRATHRLALSGTPIENNLSELWSIFAFINPGMLGNFKGFMRHFARPVEREGREDRAQLLRKICFPFVMRRTKEQVAKDLPPKSENLLLGEMLPRQQTLYEITRTKFLGQIQYAIDHYGLENSRMQVLEGLLRLRQICCHPRLADTYFTGDSGKFQLLDGCVEDVVAGGHRMLVFSQFVKALELAKSRLAERGIQSLMLTGKTSDRAGMVDRFQNSSDIPVFFISLKAGGVGLNLTAADYVVHLDPWWNPAVEAQATDRAYRIGQTKPVFVYKMIMKNTIEERVLALQDAKKGLADQVVRTESSFFKKLSRTDIIELLS